MFQVKYLGITGLVAVKRRVREYEEIYINWAIIESLQGI